MASRSNEAGTRGLARQRWEGMEIQVSSMRREILSWEK